MVSKAESEAERHTRRPRQICSNRPLSGTDPCLPKEPYIRWRGCKSPGGKGHGDAAFLRHHFGRTRFADWCKARTMTMANDDSYLNVYRRFRSHDTYDAVFQATLGKHRDQLKLLDSVRSCLTLGPGDGQHEVWIIEVGRLVNGAFCTNIIYIYIINYILFF